MRVLAVLLLLAAALTATAQQPEIVGFVPDGPLTWTNADTNGRFGVEWTMDLNWTWIPFDEDLWDLQPSSTVCETWVPLDDLISVDWSAMGETLASKASSHFFRIVSSPNDLVQPYATNLVRLANEGTNTLTTVEFGLIDQSSGWTTITNVPDILPGAASAAVPLAQPARPPWEMTMVCSGPNCYPTEGWYVSFGQTGSNRTFQFCVLPFGPYEKHISLTVSNQALTFAVEWLNYSHTTGD